MDLEPRVRRAGLLAPGRPVLAMVSGGRDSVCLLDLAVRAAGPECVVALHVNYGLRDGAAADEAHVRGLCEHLGVAHEVHRAQRDEGGGNLQAWAREERYAAASRIALERGSDVATGHTASDQVETVLYRLAASPGRRALLGMRARDGRTVRPLLEFTRAETAAHCEARGLTWREDPSNADPVFARTRVRHALMEALRSLHDSAEDNVLRTVEVLRDEAAVLDELVERALRDAGWGGGPAPVIVERLSELAPALRRLAIQRMADAARADAPAVGRRADEILALAAGGGTGTLELGGGLRAVVSYGELRFETGERPVPPVPVVVAEPGDWPPGDGVFDADALGDDLEVRAWRAGDRMRPIGLGGSKSLQDLFTDRKVPRERRHELPVVVARGEIAWIPGVAGADAFKVTDATVRRVRLRVTGA